MHMRQLNEREGLPKVDLERWCIRHGLNIQALEDAEGERAELGAFLEDTCKITPSRASITDMTSVRKALAVAFCTHAAIHRSGDTYRTVHENTPALLSPHSSLVGSNYEWVVYTVFRTTGGKQYLEIATAINAEWLVVSLFQNHSLLTQ